MVAKLYLLNKDFRIVDEKSYTIDEYAEKHGFQDSLLCERLDLLTKEYEIPRNMPDWVIEYNNVIVYLKDKITTNSAMNVLLLAAPPVLSSMNNTITLILASKKRKYSIKEFATKYNLMHILRNQMIIAVCDL